MGNFIGALFSHLSIKEWLTSKSVTLQDEIVFICVPNFGTEVKKTKQ